MKKYPAPHIRSNLNTQMIYTHILIALLPCVVAAVYYFGLPAFILLFLAAVSYTMFEYIFVKFVRHDTYVWDGSGLVSGLILALILPPTIPIWLLLTAVFFASIVVRQCFGGLGNNLFNPPLAAVAFAAIAFPRFMSVYTPPLESRWAVSSLLLGPLDIVSSATPMVTQSEGFFQLLSGRYAGAIGETCAIFILAAGIYLYKCRCLRLSAPLTYLAVMSLGYWAIHRSSGSIQGMFYSLLTGGILFATVFVLDDYATIPISRMGRMIFGGGAAILTLIIRQFGNPTWAITFAVLSMNLMTVLLDFYIRPKLFGLKNRPRRQITSGLQLSRRLNSKGEEDIL